MIRVFISYAHESHDFKEQVNDLACWLNRNGENSIVVETDYKHLYKAPKEGWPVWMEDQIENSDIVLVICTPKYLKRFRKKEVRDSGKGATFEGAIITQELYDAYCENEKFIPIVPDNGSGKDVPNILKSFFNHFSFPTDNDKILKGILNEMPTSASRDLNIEGKSSRLNLADKYGKLVTLFTRNDHTNLHFIHDENNIRHKQSDDRILSLLENLKGDNFKNVKNAAQIKYDSIILDNTMDLNNQVENIIEKAANHAKELEFDKANLLFSKALEKVKPTDQLYDFLYTEYLITGFIWYSRVNDINGLKTLLSVKSNIAGNKNSEIEYIISIIYQEIFTRNIDLNSLRDAVFSLNTLYNDASTVSKPAMANSLGLAYRRLGERTGVSDLKKAIDIFKEGLQVNKDDIMEVELKDQMAITYIRLFEFNKDKMELNNAEKLLIECLELLTSPLHTKYYRLKPRVLNNYGNVHKQRLFKLKDLASASKAIACYENAEEYWNKKDANYDWALLRKNIAETKYGLGKITHDIDLLLQAVKDSILSTKYRTLKDSPYQWGKSVEIAFSITIFLDELHSLKRMSKVMRKKIILNSNIVMNDEIKWQENLSYQFVEFAQKAQSLLLGLG